MARWRVTPGTKDNSLDGTIEYNKDLTDTAWKIEQDETPYIEEVKRDRELLASGKNPPGYRKMCTIPDIVAIEMLNKHNMDIHDPLFMHNPSNMKRLRYIIQTEYPHLLVST